MTIQVAPQGMEGVVAADSSITSIDGQRGELRYRGYSIEDLAASCSFEEVVGLLWDGELPRERSNGRVRARTSVAARRSPRLARRARCGPGHGSSA